MAHYRAPHQARRRLPWLLTIAVAAVVVVAGGGFGWWYWASRQPLTLVKGTESQADGPGLLVADATPPPGEPSGQTDVGDEPPPVRNIPAPVLTGQAGADEILDPRPAPAQQTESPAQQPAAEARGPEVEQPAERAALAAARQRYEAGKVIEARHELNALLKTKLSSRAQAEVRRLLTRIADETIFSKRRVDDDPLVETYTIQPGDVLIQIGRKYGVPAEGIMRINRIPDARRIRADQPIKVPRGPFHARIYKSAFRLDVYLGDLYVRSFPVGLGADYNTPEGVWRVKNRLENPTYYPPASAEDKRIIAADDPKNPLGEHWIGLEGVEGDTVGRKGYGIHGTIAPETIGKNASAGCVRMLNEDVAFLYGLMQPGRSMVTVLP